MYIILNNLGLGPINPPPGVSTYQGLKEGGLVLFLNNLMILIFTISGLVFFVNLILAGFLYISAGSDPQKISQAGVKILNSIIGLAVLAASFIIAAIVGQLFFQDAAALIKPTFYSPQ